MKRNEQRIEDTWKIDDIFPNVQAWQDTMDSIYKQAKELSSYQGKLHSATSLKAFLDFKFKMEEQLENCIDYASLQSDQDSGNAYFQNMKGKVMTLSSQVDSLLSFADIEILKLSDDTLSQFYIQEPSLNTYKNVLYTIRRRKDHYLDSHQEQLIAMSQEVFSSPSHIYNILNDADTHFEDILDSQGNAHPLTSGTYFDYIESSDRTLRKNAFESLYASYQSHANTFAALLNTQARQLKILADARGYPSSVEASLDVTNVPVSVYKNLMDAVHKDIHILHKYMKVRKKLLKLDQVHMYDLYASLIPECEKEVSFDKAKEEVLDSISILGNEYQSIYKKGLSSRWIDIYENEGKRSGAYSNGANIHPFVLLNHTPTLRSEFTLAHEMGHAMHSYLSNHYQPYCDSKYKIFVAEVASTCNEALLMNKLLNETQNPLEKAYLINYFLEQFRTILYRQVLLAEFEWKINEEVAKGETLTVPLLNSIYHELNAFYYGDDCVIDSSIDYEWAKIPHLYMNFYLYQYATGFSAAMALSQKLLKGNQEDIDAYLNFLKGGCSKSPIDLLKMAGIDMTTPEPIHQALSMFDHLIDEMNECLESI